MKAFAAKWRSLGIACLIYLVDVIVLGPSGEYLLRVRPSVLRDLEASGVRRNFSKSVPEVGR